MSAVKDAAEALLAALKGVQGVRAYSDPAASLSPPATVLGPPVLSWETLSIDPLRATFIVYVVTSADDRALERLWDLVPAVASAVGDDGRFAATRAAPGAWSTGGQDLPAYLLTVETTL